MREDPLESRGSSMALSGTRGWRMLLLFFFLFPLTVRSQPGFVSVNCGGGPDGSFVDRNTGITWQTDYDGNFVATGETVISALDASLPAEMQTLRFFPSYTKNCYAIPTSPSLSYLIRVGFFYGNYDGKASSQIEFRLALDSTAWQTVTLKYDPAGGNAPQYFEAITSNATSTNISVCLIKSGGDTPFINSLEARLINDSDVYTGSFSDLVNLYLVGRANFGETFTTYRYPDDPWDRMWLPYTDLEGFPQLQQLETVSTSSLNIISSFFSRDNPPSVVMATAVQGQLISYSRPMPATDQFFAVQYFADITLNGASDSRVINWSTNIVTGPPPVVNITSIPPFTILEYGYQEAPTTGPVLTYTLSRNVESTLDAILNADEMYGVQPVAVGTSSSDVLALSKISSDLRLRQWVGDPCLPVSWDELNCSSPATLTPPRILSIDLSHHNLSGPLPEDFGNLSALNTLLLNDNSLSGPLPPGLASLTNLRTLNLGDNSFNGSFPTFLTRLQLTALDVSNNNFGGTFPDTLLRINFSYSGNPLLSCSGPTCPATPPPRPAASPGPPPKPTTDNSPGGKKKVPVVVIIGAVVGGIAFLAIIIIIAAVGYCFCTSRSAQVGMRTRAVEASVVSLQTSAKPTSSSRSVQASFSPRSVQSGSPPRNPRPFEPAVPTRLQPAASPAPPWSAAETVDTNSQGSAPSSLPTVKIVKGKAQQLTLSAIRNATSNFSTKIGEGSFGSVFRGQLLDGIQRVEVAVKVLSTTSAQGEKQFTTEIEFLSMLHHKSLVQIIGFCHHGPERILVYEYMAGGDLGARLHGAGAAANPLDWKQRLRIALDAAQGLEYLHHLCSPSIVHRDVKSSNILLGKTLEAKVADFGLSKMISQDGEITTDKTITQAGTVGHEYIDPEFFTTSIITRESDVFSYGVILMEIITGRSPITKPNLGPSLVGWVRTLVTKANLTAMTDPLLANLYDNESMWEVIELALRCTDAFRINRPTMAEVAGNLAKLVQKGKHR